MMRLVRGCRDILPPVANLRRHVTELFIKAASLRCCVPIETPIVEHRDLFSSLGDASDINQHQTFTISDTSPVAVLRPEGTAGIARSMHKLVGHDEGTSENRFWYAGAMFRRERPQAGRYRQFTQLGVEFLGSGRRRRKDKEEQEKDDMLSIDDDFDAIELAFAFLNQLTPVRVRVHSLGTLSERRMFNDQLQEYLTPYLKDLPKQAVSKIETGHALRLLDDIEIDSSSSTSSQQQQQDTCSSSGLLHDILQHAPRLRDVLSTQSRQRFDMLCDTLTKASIPFVVDHTLVRGLDYYAGTIFEVDALFNGWVLGGGGHYTLANLDGLQGVGFAIGLERLETLISQQKSSVIPDLLKPVPVIALGSHSSPQHAAARSVVTALREYEVAAFVQLAHVGGKRGRRSDSNSNLDENVGEDKGHVSESRPLSKIIAMAAAQNVPAVVVIGSDDVGKGMATVKPIVQSQSDEIGTGTVTRTGTEIKKEERFQTPTQVDMDRVHHVVKEMINRQTQLNYN